MHFTILLSGFFYVLMFQYYQALFRDGECFLHVVSLLNSDLDEGKGERLVLNVLQTLTHLLANNDTSKVLSSLLSYVSPFFSSLVFNSCRHHITILFFHFVLMKCIVNGLYCYVWSGSSF